MLNPEKNSIWRAARLKKAMQAATPPIKQSDLARTCNVSKQVVHGWLKTGRIDKRYLPALAELIRQPVEFLLEQDVEPQAVMRRKGQHAGEEIAPYTINDKMLARVTRDWLLLSDIDRRRIYNDVTQKADHVRNKIREHEQHQQQAPIEAPGASVINRVVDFIKRPRKPRP